ncbi:MAG: hypothetical protein K2W85_06060 [Phycisphaerales bacterium]|nr:hypothetical protein [Phycisphaerales bacterium]
MGASESIIGPSSLVDIPSRMLRVQTAHRLYGVDHPTFRSALAATIQVLVSAAEAAPNRQISLRFEERSTMIDANAFADEAGRELAEIWHSAGVAEVVVRSSATTSDLQALMQLMVAGWSREDSARLAADTGGRIVTRGVAEVASQLTASGGSTCGDWSGVIRKLIGENSGDEWSDIDEAAASAALETALNSSQVDACVEQLASGLGSGDARRDQRTRALVQKLVARLTDDQIANLLRLDQSLSQQDGARLASISGVLPAEAIKGAIDHLSRCGKAPPRETLLLLSRFSGLASGPLTPGSGAPVDARALEAVLRARADGAEYTPDDYRQDLTRSAHQGVKPPSNVPADLRAAWTRPLAHALSMLAQMLRAATLADECAAIFDALEHRIRNTRIIAQDLERLRAFVSVIAEITLADAPELARSRWLRLLRDSRFLAQIEGDLRDGRLELSAVRWILSSLNGSQLIPLLSAIAARPDGREAAREFIAARGSGLDEIVRSVQELPREAAGLAAVLVSAVEDARVADVCQSILPTLADAPGEAECMMSIADTRLTDWPPDLVIAALRCPADAVLRMGIRRAVAATHPYVRAMLMDVLSGDLADAMSPERHIAMVYHWAHQHPRPKAAIRQLISHELRTLRPSAMARAARLTKALLKSDAPPPSMQPPLRRSA